MNEQGVRIEGYVSSLYDNTYGSYILGCHYSYYNSTDYTYMIQINFTQSGTSLKVEAYTYAKQANGYVSSSDLTTEWNKSELTSYSNSGGNGVGVYDLNVWLLE